ncbi:23S rRNA (adenine(2503)-C(2))-methyltransferase RlmN [Candidatus Liberibacter americanus]|uniref:Dual-specificity RNA methyltransferase RlmN n=1 Tax=Candidatus Liberibacter americanus str. Sao Paulo TaxID=1261131 RepID=U6B8I8_9HYPH|nr:23S rRNA (adenine(2503)-C(2))-methyltransferase RlmN [Candidatus Liberibacter americanus]AHA28052.1 Fe-S-cluster redox enzyme [Candidatus Liberibacter americanus str. Sao Paulo]EMS35978.1 radical SAM protein [Candidatus Liberibacter americanus PW_SP]
MTLISKKSLIGLKREEIEDLLLTIRIPKSQVKMLASQIWKWIYVRGVRDFEFMSDISQEIRHLLNQHFSIIYPEIIKDKISTDGTRKWLLRFSSQDCSKPVDIETVYIPEKSRGTLCVSSQVGCSLTCSFCYTGTQKLVRNLNTEEILLQILLARSILGDFAGSEDVKNMIVPLLGRKVSNIVMMGMGEPLCNFDNVKQALLIASDSMGLSFSKRRITLSTSGFVPNILRVGTEIGVMLAISLHAVNDNLRNILVPINRKYPIKTLIETCRNYPDLSNARRITFEYVMLKGINDSPRDAIELVKLLKGIPAKINLIPFNPWPGSNYICSDFKDIEIFSELVKKAGYSSPIRKPRGLDILAACGQLKSLSKRDNKKLSYSLDNKKDEKTVVSIA